MTSNASVEPIRIGPFRLYPAARKLVFGKDQVPLGGRAMDVLLALAHKNGELVSKEELFAAAWPNTFVHDDNLKVTIAALRRALRECWPGAEFISTVVGRGYWLNTHVSQDETGEEAAAAPAAGAGPSRNQNLPSGIARIYGRADEIEVIGDDLKTSRLVSIVGAGGIGKTTVAIAVAETLVGAKKDGVWIVDFATVQDPSMAPVAIATALGMKTHSAAILDAL